MAFLCRCFFLSTKFFHPHVSQAPQDNFNPSFFSSSFMSCKRLYFLTHEGNPGVFSGYGISLKEGTKSPLIGMLLLDRPMKCPPEYLDRIYDAFGDYQIGPMTSNGDRGLYTRMTIEDPLSLDLLRDDIYNSVAEMIADVLHNSVKGGFMPNPKLRVRWSPEARLWVSELDL